MRIRFNGSGLLKAALAIVLLCCLCAFAYAASDHSGKKEVDVPESLLGTRDGRRIECVVYYGGSSRNRMSVLLSDGDSTDRDLSGEITLVSGPDEAKDAVYFVEDGGYTYYTVDTTKVSQPCAAT